MKTAIVYYSLDGNCAIVAHEINSILNTDIIRLHTTKDKKRSKIGNMFWGVGMVFLGKKPPLKPYSFNPAAYEKIIIGAPVWADSPAPPVKTFISESGLSGKKIAIFLCHAGSAGDSAKKFKELLAGNEIIGEIDFKNAAKSDKEALKQQIADWVNRF